MTTKEFPATPKARQKARQRGNVSKGSFLSAAVAVSVGFYLSFWLFRFGWLAPHILVKFCYFTDFSGGIVAYKRGLILSLVSVTLCLLASGLFGTIAEYAQLGFRIYFGSGFRIQGRLSITSGFQSLVTRCAQLWVVAVVVIAFVTVLTWFYYIALLRWMQNGFIPGQFPWLSISALAIALIAIGVLDHWIRRCRHDQTLRMSREELKEEAKEAEGDPFIRSHRRSQHLSLVHQSLEQRIKRAKVVVVERSSKS